MDCARFTISRHVLIRLNQVGFLGGVVHSLVTGNEYAMGVVRACSVWSWLEDHAMTGSCCLWLLLVTFHSLVCVAPFCCQYVLNVKEDYRLTFVLAIKNSKSGLQLELYQSLYDLEYSGHVVNSGASQWPDHELEPQIHFIPGHRLSPECGNQYFRCQELLIINESLFVQNDSREFITIIFVPLENDVLLLSFWHDSTIWHWSEALLLWTVLTVAPQCSITSIAPSTWFASAHTNTLLCTRYI